METVGYLRNIQEEWLAAIVFQLLDILMVGVKPAEQGCLIGQWHLEEEFRDWRRTAFCELGQLQPQQVYAVIQGGDVKVEMSALR